MILRRWTMNLRRAWFAVGFGILTLAACGEPADPAHIGAPSFAAGGVGRPAVLVNPNANDNGTAKTIQEGIDMVAEGGTVMVLPATSPTPPFPQVFGIRVQGDVDALLEENVIRRTGGACIYVVTRNDFGGETNADILKNDLDECYPLQRQGSVLVIFPVVPTTPVTVTGVVNIVGNSIRNSSHSCLPTTAISQNFASGRIEHNRILDVVQPCATATNTRNPAALWIGSFSSAIPPVSPIVRFNDIEGNAHAGLRVAPNITTPLDTRCNWWGSAGGPAVGTDPPGSDIVLEAGAAAPTFMPFATTPIAETDATGC